jgi:hypothetical protein
VNQINNASIELDTYHWFGVNAMVTRDASVSKFGRASLRVTAVTAAPLAALYQGIYLPQPTAHRKYSLSFWVYVPARSPLIGQPMTLVFAELGGLSPDRYTNGTPSALRAGWQRLHRLETIVANDRLQLELELSVVNNAPSSVFFVDGALCLQVAGPRP